MKNNAKYIIGLTGLKQSGKDTVATMMFDWVYEMFPKTTPEFNMTHLYHRIAFADQLKQDIACLTGGTVEAINKYKLQPALRAILQWYGTDYCRANDPEHWIKVIREKIAAIPHGLIIITDVRFPNEEKLVHDFGGLLLRVERKQVCQARDTHSSETSVISLLADRTIHNHGTKIMLHSELKNLLPYVLQHFKLPLP